MTDLPRCCCGEIHELSARVRGAYDRVTEGKPPDQKIRVLGHGTWKIPRIYIAVHGIRGYEVPALAERYGWEKIA